MQPIKKKKAYAKHIKDGIQSACSNVPQHCWPGGSDIEWVMCCRRIVLCSSLQLEFRFLISSACERCCGVSWASSAQERQGRGAGPQCISLCCLWSVMFVLLIMDLFPEFTKFHEMLHKLKTKLAEKYVVHAGSSYGMLLMCTSGHNHAFPCNFNVLIMFQEIRQTSFCSLKILGY